MQPSVVKTLLKPIRCYWLDACATDSMSFVHRMLVRSMRSHLILEVADARVGGLHLHCSYLGHTDLAYGCDWCYAAQWQRVVASCSFYDQLLHLWTLP